VRTYGIDEDGRKDFNKIETARTVTVFGQKGKWNRIGAYIVHVALLTLFLGHFVANWTGFDADVRMVPGNASDSIQMIAINLDKREKFDVKLPFTVTCTDIEQKLIDPRGNIGVQNTMDWRTRIQIDDPEYGQTVADVSMNNPFSYRGYRFFQAQASNIGSARSIQLELTSQATGDVQRITIPRLGSSTLNDGTFIEYDEFLPDFTFNAEGNPDTRSGEYNNPAAVLSVTPVGGERQRVFAFESGKADNIPVGAPKAGYKWRVASYEKVPFFHVLSIKYDPYSGAFIAWYFGGFGLIFALCFVFFFSHRRIWANVEPSGSGTYLVTVGGHANRNHSAFEDKFRRIADQIREQ
jgi:cytochrome c biogenesis protein